MNNFSAESSINSVYNLESSCAGWWCLFVNFLAHFSRFALHMWTLKVVASLIFIVDPTRVGIRCFVFSLSRTPHLRELHSVQRFPARLRVESEHFYAHSRLVAFSHSTRREIKFASIGKTKLFYSLPFDFRDKSSKKKTFRSKQLLKKIACKVRPIETY